MITPSFKLDQNDEFLLINIKAPFAKLNDLDVFIDETDFRFYCKPYFLRLNLPASILENDEEINYDFDERKFKLRYRKKNAGEVFEGLDLLTKLLTPNCAPQKLANNLIEEIGEDQNEISVDHQNGSDSDDEEEEVQWYIHQNVNKDEDGIEVLNSSLKYGFANTKSNIFSKLNNEYEMIIDLPDPDNNTQNRSQLRITDEHSKFNDDHYLADYFDNSEMIDSLILEYEPDYQQSEAIIEYTEAETETLKNLPKKKHLLDKCEKLHAYTGLIDILFAYLYNERINCGEENIETAWTISKVSSSLSWLDTFDSLDQVLIASFRRSLCIPLYRNWKLSEKVLADLIFVLKKGHKLILKCLLGVRAAFMDGENRYILNDLYINDYCIWIQYASQTKLSALITSLEKIRISKEMMGFDLDVLELLAQEQMVNGADSCSESSESNAESSSGDDDDEDGSSDENNSDSSDRRHNKEDVASEFELKLSLDSKSEVKKPKIEILD